MISVFSSLLIIICSVRAIEYKDHIESHIDIDGVNTKIAFAQSEGYESGGFPDNTWQTWTFRLLDNKHFQLRLKCSDVRLAKENPCNDNVFIIDDGNTKDEYCGDYYDLEKNIQGNFLRLDYKVKTYGGGGLLCEVVAVKVNEEIPETPLTEESINLSQKGDKYLARTLDYHSGGIPGNTKQKWTFNFHPVNPNLRMNLNCRDIRFIQENPCKNCKFIIDDGRDKQILCGVHYDITKIIRGNFLQLAVEVKTGGGGASCEVSVIEVDENEMPVTTTTTPRPTYKPTEPPEFLDWETEEMNTNEHGTYAGSKKTTCKCGWTNKPGYTRILNGVEASRNEYPFIAHIIETADNWGFCGGSIISPWHVLTAAHCTWKKEETGIGLSVMLGMHERKEAENGIPGVTQKIRVKKIIEYPTYNYTKNAGMDDIAILVLERKIEYTQYVGPICMSEDPLDYLTDGTHYAKAIGWGAERIFGAGKEILQKLTTRLIPLKQCAHFYGMVQDKTPSVHICAYRKNRQTCSGDSGGPLVWLDPDTNRYTLLGATSFGRICGDKDPAVFTRVHSYFSWIKQVIKDTHPEHLCLKIN